MQEIMETIFRRPQTLQESLNLLTNLFPMWVILSVIVGIVRPRRQNPITSSL
jgi:hypothetical protein